MRAVMPGNAEIHADEVLDDDDAGTSSVSPRDHSVFVESKPEAPAGRS